MSSIAAELYRDASAWETIYDANRDLLKTPDELQVGQTLRIPPAPTPGPTSAVEQAVLTAIPATRIPARSVPATSVPATRVPPTAAATAISATDGLATSVPPVVAPATAAPLTSEPSAPPSFVPATGPTVIALTAAANPTAAPAPTTPPTPV